MDRILSNAEDLEVVASFRALRPISLGRLPLREGASIVTPQGEFRVERVTPGTYSLSVTVSRVRVKSTLESRPALWAGRAEWGVALAREGREGIPNSQWGNRHGTGKSPLVLGPQLVVETMEATFNAGPVDPDGSIRELDPTWLQGGELMVIGTEYLGTFQKDLLLQGVHWPELVGVHVRIPGDGPGSR